MKHRKIGGLLPRLGSALLIPIVVLTGCVQAGKGGSLISGSSGGETSVDANASLERCDAPLGTLAVDDGTEQNDWIQQFYQATKVTTIEPLIRLAVQQSNCFVITSIGNIRSSSRLTRITNIQRESGEYRTGSKQHKGQRVAADYYLEPSIVIDDAPTGDLAADLGGLFHPVVGIIAGSLETSDSVVTLTLTDIRSTVQVAASEGSATASSFGGTIGAFGGGGSGSLSGLSRTPAGKATIAAFLDAYNGMVRALRQYKAQDVKGGLGRGGTLKVN